MFRVFMADGFELHKGYQITSSRDEPWIYDNCVHPRKISVHWDEDPNGEPFWPNRSSREFYASVFNAGIWDVEREEWTFPPSGPLATKNPITATDSI